MSARISDLSLLHPEVRLKVVDLLGRLSAESLPFQVFESYRTPERQASLYAEGRLNNRPKVTNARPWQSYHQYGLAADFVLFQDGHWSWDDQGPRAALWQRLHELGGEVGLEPLSWERPHLQLMGIRLDDVYRGNYPDWRGDATWYDNIEGVIMNWRGDPPAPNLPPGGPARPPLGDVPLPAVAPTESGWQPPGPIPPPAVLGPHNVFGGIAWRVDSLGVYRTAPFNRPERTSGEPLTCRAILRHMKSEILNASVQHSVPPELIIMTIATESGVYKDQGFTGAATFRWEPGVTVRDSPPPFQGDYSAGPMQTLATTARWVIGTRGLAFEPFSVAPVYRSKPLVPAEHPLYDYSTNIDIGTAEIRQRWSHTGADPILVAAAFNAGGLYSTSNNPWHLRAYGDHLDRAAQWYGDACAVLREAGLR